jgi:hypothetical protein
MNPAADQSAAGFLSLACLGGGPSVPADRGPQRDADQRRAPQAGDDLGDMDKGLQEHDHRQRDDGVEGAVFQIAILGQRAFLDQHDGHGPHIHGPDAQPDGDDE